MPGFPPHFASSACLPCYAPYPPCPIDQPCRPGKSILGDISCDEHQSLRVTLLHRLNKPRGLRNQPGAFPFTSVLDRSTGSFQTSFNSFEFHEELLIPSQTPNGRPRSRIATIAFTQPNEDKSTMGYLTWRIYFPLVDSTCLRTVTSTHQAGRIAVAHVQVEPLLLSDPWFGRKFCEDSSILIRALAMSLESGRLVTIQYKYKCDPRSGFHSKGDWNANPVVYLSTTNDGRQEILFAIERP